MCCPAAAATLRGDGGGGQLCAPHQSGTLSPSLQPLLGWEDTAAYCALPLIIVATQYLTQALITPPVDESLDEKTKASQKRVQGILKYIPLSIGWFSLQVPSALCLYWFTSNIMSAVSTTSIRVS